MGYARSMWIKVVHPGGVTHMLQILHILDFLSFYMEPLKYSLKEKLHKLRNEHDNNVSQANKLTKTSVAINE